MERFDTPEQLAAHYGLTLDHAALREFNAGCGHNRPALRAEIWTADTIVAIAVCPAWAYPSGWTFAEALNVSIRTLAFYGHTAELTGDAGGMRTIWREAQANAIPVPAKRANAADIPCRECG